MPKRERESTDCEALFPDLPTEIVVQMYMFFEPRELPLGIDPFLNDDFVLRELHRKHFGIDAADWCRNDWTRAADKDSNFSESDNLRFYAMFGCSRKFDELMSTKKKNLTEDFQCELMNVPCMFGYTDIPMRLIQSWVYKPTKFKGQELEKYRFKARYGYVLGYHKRWDLFDRMPSVNELEFVAALAALVFSNGHIPCTVDDVRRIRSISTRINAPAPHQHIGMLLAKCRVDFNLFKALRYCNQGINSNILKHLALGDLKHPEVIIGIDREIKFKHLTVHPLLRVNLHRCTPESFITLVKHDWHRLYCDTSSILITDKKARDILLDSTLDRIYHEGKISTESIAVMKGLQELFLARFSPGIIRELSGIPDVSKLKKIKDILTSPY